jgi:ABC-type methionine transport system ATPase subunit
MSHMASGAQPYEREATIPPLPLPTNLTSAFTLKGVRQVKEGITVVDDVELDIPHGEIIALVGPSGAGKTSLLRLLNRLDDPVSGEILYRARRITQYPVQELRRKVGFVFQTPVMFPGTVRANLSMALALGGEPGTDSDERMAAALALAELDRALCDREGDQLSGGQKQRVNIARALMTSPDVLLMDEPTSALDPETAERLMETTRRLSREQHLTVVMVTHRFSEARRTSDRTIVLERGRVVASGSTVEVFEHTTNPRIRTFLDTEK